MAQYLTELCTLLVDDLYGELSSRVFATLASLGRLPIAGIVQHSGLRPRDTKHGLVVLIQQHLVHHYTDSDDVTYYEANWQHAYNIVRSGKMIKLVEDRFGEEAGGIISNMFLLGHAKIGDLADAYGLRGKKQKGEGDDGIDGVAQDKKFASLKELHSQLRKLLEAGYLTPLHENHFRSAADLHNEAEAHILRTYFQKGAPKGVKKVAEFQRLVKEHKAKMREQINSQIQIDSVKTGSKRAHDFGIPQPKRLRLNGFANGFSALNGTNEEILLDDELVVTINHDKCNVALRSQQLVDLAARYIGESTSKVYEGMLRVLEDKVSSIDDAAYYEDEEAEAKAQPSVTTMEVVSALPPDLELAAGLYDVDGDMNGAGEDGDGMADSGDLSEEQSAAVLRNKRKLLAERHIRLLAEDPRHFTYWVGSKGGGEWKIDFRSLSDTLVQHQIENTVQARYGPLATRFIRLLHAKGKLDEKQVSNLGMVRQKDIRAILACMQEAGIVETQEVPKDNSRQPSRTLYLWSYDQDHVRQLILADTYKAMSRLLQRIRVEKAKYQAVIDKSERTDVVGNEDRFLTATERKGLRTWWEIEEKLLNQLGRQDDLVAVFRDFVKPLNA